MSYLTLILTAALLAAVWRSLNAYRRLSRVSPMLADFIWSVTITLLAGIGTLAALVLTLRVAS